VVRVIDFVSETHVVYTRTVGDGPGEYRQYSRQRPLALRDYWDSYETAKCFRVGVQVFPAVEVDFGCNSSCGSGKPDNQVEVKVTTGGQSKSVVFDVPTATEVQQLREQLRTFDAANLWQANQIKALTHDNEQLRKERDGARTEGRKILENFWSLNETQNRQNKQIFDLREELRGTKEQLIQTEGLRCSQVRALDSQIDELTKRLADATELENRLRENVKLLQGRIDNLVQAEKAAGYYTNWDTFLARITAEHDCSTITFDAVTGEPNVGFRVGDVWECSGTNNFTRTILEVSPEWVCYKVVNNETKYRMEERISRIPGVGTCTTKNWKDYTAGLVKFTRAAA